MKRIIALLTVAIIALSCGSNNNHNVHRNYSGDIIDPSDIKAARESQIKHETDDIWRKINMKDIVPLLDAALLNDRRTSIEAFDLLCQDLFRLESNQSQYSESLTLQRLNKIYGDMFHGAIIRKEPTWYNYIEGEGIYGSSLPDFEFIGLYTKNHNAIWRVTVTFYDDDLFNRLIDKFDEEYMYINSVTGEDNKSIEHFFIHEFAGYTIRLSLYHGFEREFSYTIVRKNN